MIRKARESSCLYLQALIKTKATMPFDNFPIFLTDNFSSYVLKKHNALTINEFSSCFVQRLPILSLNQPAVENIKDWLRRFSNF